MKKKSSFNTRDGKRLLAVPETETSVNKSSCFTRARTYLCTRRSGDVNVTANTHHTHAFVHALQHLIHARVHLYLRNRSAPDREIKEKRRRRRRTRSIRGAREKTRSIRKPCRIAYFKTITKRFSCSEDDGIALSFDCLAMKNDPR